MSSKRVGRKGQKVRDYKRAGLVLGRRNTITEELAIEEFTCEKGAEMMGCEETTIKRNENRESPKSICFVFFMRRVVWLMAWFFQQECCCLIAVDFVDVELPFDGGGCTDVRKDGCKNYGVIGGWEVGEDPRRSTKRQQKFGAKVIVCSTFVR